jgi:hypothetical protein
LADTWFLNDTQAYQTMEVFHKELDDELNKIPKKGKSSDAWNELQILLET